MSCSELKEKVKAHCTAILEGKLLIINQELKHLSQAIAEDNKSSAGDKYETGREMANLEKEKLHAQALSFNKSLTAIAALPAGNLHKISIGSLVKTDKEWIYLAVSLGQVEVEAAKVLVISPVAPLAQHMLGREKGETVNFRNNNYHILNIC